MGRLMATKMIYLATPIDRAFGGYRMTAKEASLHLADAGYVVYSPALAFAVPAVIPDSDDVSYVNGKALEWADAMVAWLPTGVSTIGVPMELQRALDREIPVAIVGARDSWHLAEYQDRMVDAWSDVVAMLERQFEERVEQGLKQEMLGVFDIRVVGEGKTPTRSYSGDAGFDLYYHGDDEIHIGIGAVADVPSGIRVQGPPGVWFDLRGRSSTFRNKGLFCNPAVIDSGYRGELFAVVRNISDRDQVIKPGERVAQLIPMPNFAESLDVVRVDALDESDRGEAGFGSSGD